MPTLPPSGAQITNRSATSGANRRRDEVPTDGHAPDPGTELLQAAIDAHHAARRCAALGALELAAGLIHLGDTTLGQAWRHLAPEARRTISGRVREPDRQDDAEQLAFLKLWQAVRNYNPKRGPVKSGAAFARWAADKTALNVVEHRERVQGREHGALDVDETRDIIEYRAAQMNPNALGETKAIADYAKLVAEYAGSRDRGRLWAAIVLAAGEGHVDRRAIAEYVSNAIGRDIPEVSIRREIFHMVREAPHPHDGIGKVRRIVDWRTRELEASDTGELSLFATEFQEIA